MSAKVEAVLIEVSPGETRAASIDKSGRLVAFEVERLGEASRIGEILRGRVARIDKGTQTAFVDIGGDEPGIINRARNFHEGQAVTVQVTRDAWGGKGPALSTNLAFTGRFMVLRPGESGVRWPRGISGRVRRDFDATVSALAREDEGLTLRTNLALASEESLSTEIERLRAQASDIEERGDGMGKPGLLLAASSLVDRVLRDAAPEGGIVLDDRRLVAEIAKTVNSVAPDLADRVALHDEKEALFDEAEIDDQLETALSRTVGLPRGGSLVFDELEALTVIDVNASGGGRLSDDAILSLNRRAAEEAARQVMLRNVAGLIVIDFVSMKNKGARRQVVEAVRRAFADDRVVVDVLGMTPAGLVEVTRQRRGRSLADMMCVPVGRDRPLQAASIACAGLRAALRSLGGGKPVLRCHPEIAAVLRGALAPALEDTERRLGQALELREDAGRDDVEMLWERRK
jgi:ribonuclease G